MGGPLDGTTVVSIAVNLPGPYAAERLTAMGARTIKIEPPSGDPLHHVAPKLYRTLSAGQDIRTVDLKTDDGKQALEGLLASSDVFITAMRPLALRRLGLDDAVKRHRQLTHIEIVGYDGADSNRAGHDLTYPRSTDELLAGGVGLIGVEGPAVGRGEFRASHPGRPLRSRLGRCRGGGQLAVAGGGAWVAVKSRSNAVCQGQASGRCRVIRRADRASRAGTVMRVRRIVAVVALASRPARSAISPAVRVRLNAITARTSQALFAVNTPDGRCASGPPFISAWTCSMIA